MLKLAEGQSYTIGFSGILAPHESDRIVFQKTGGSCSGARNLWDFEDDQQLVTNARVAVPPTLDAGYHILCRCASEELRLSCATADLFWNELPGVALLVSHVPPPGPRPAQPPVTALEGHVEGHEEAESTLHALVATLSATLAVVLLLVFAVLHTGVDCGVSERPGRAYPHTGRWQRSMTASLAVRCCHGPSQARTL